MIKKYTTMKLASFIVATSIISTTTVSAAPPCAIDAELRFLGYLGEVNDKGEVVPIRSVWLSTYHDGGGEIEPFRLEEVRQGNSPSNWSENFDLPLDGMHTSFSTGISKGGGGPHELYATNPVYECDTWVDKQNQQGGGIILPPEPPDPPDPPDPPIDPPDPCPECPPIKPPDPEIPIEPPIEPPDPPDPPVEPPETKPPETKPPETKPPEPIDPPETIPPQPAEPQKPSGDRLIQGILNTLTNGLTAAALERGYSISDRIVTGLIGRSYLDRIPYDSSAASFRQNLIGLLKDKEVNQNKEILSDQILASTNEEVADRLVLGVDSPVQAEPPVGPGREFGVKSDYNLWADGQYFDISDDRYDIDASGSINELRIGLDRIFNEDLVLGIAGGFEKLENTAYSGTVNVEQDGFFIGPYLGYRFSEFTVFDIWLGYSNGDGESRISMLEGDFDTDRYFVSANISAQYTTENQFNFRPKFSFYYGNTEIEDHNLRGDPSKTNGISGVLEVDDDSFNNGVAEISVETNRIYNTSKNTYTMPFFRLGVSYAFERPNDGVVLTPEFTEEDTSDVLGNVHAGFRMLIDEQFVTEVRVGYYSIGESDFDVWDGRLVLSYFF